MKERTKKRDLNYEVFEDFHERIEEEVVLWNRALLSKDLYGILSVI